jgi:hypothetical protein
MALSSRISARLWMNASLKFIAYAIDISGTALAVYDLAAIDAESAEQEARQYLEQHPVIEIWGSDHRRVARLVRKT